MQRWFCIIKPRYYDNCLHKISESIEISQKASKCLNLPSALPQSIWRNDPGKKFIQGHMGILWHPDIVAPPNFEEERGVKFRYSFVHKTSPRWSKNDKSFGQQLYTIETNIFEPFVWWFDLVTSLWETAVDGVIGCHQNWLNRCITSLTPLPLIFLLFRKLYSCTSVINLTGSWPHI